MPVQITVRRVEVPKGAQAYAEERAQTIMNEFSKVEHVRVLLSGERGRLSAEFVVQAKGCPRTGARHTGHEWVATINGAARKAEKLLLKTRSKMIRRHRGAAGIPPAVCD